MSHNVTLTNVKITDLNLFGKIAAQLSDGRAKLNSFATEFRTYPGQPNKCHAKIEMPGAHDIGLLQTADGAYTPIFDPYRMDTVFMAGGNKIGKLLQEYALQQAEYEAAQNGMSATRIENKDGTVTLELVPAT